jgi:hypothetical protein
VRRIRHNLKPRTTGSESVLSEAVKVVTRAAPRHAAQDTKSVVVGVYRKRRFDRTFKCVGEWAIV